MEIDFMGLYSKNSPPAYDSTEQHGYEADAFIDSGIGSGEGNVSLSLYTSSSMDEETAFPDFLRKKMRKSPAENMNSICMPACNHDSENAQPVEQSSISLVGKQILIRPSGFRNNNDDKSTISRNKIERHHPFPASSTVFCPTAAPNADHAQKVDKKMYATGDVSFDDTRKSTDGYTPTVAMARKATLARFLEKRSHRLNQQITPHLMGRDTTFAICNKKKNNSMQFEVL